MWLLCENECNSAAVSYISAQVLILKWLHWT